MSIFLSYRRNDSPGHAGRLHDGLAVHFGDAKVFMDVEDIEAGSNFKADVEQGAGKSDVVLVVIGRLWASITDHDRRRRLDRDDDVVRLEVRTALEGAARVIPVLVDGATMPAPSSLPGDLAALSELNAVELSHRRWRVDLAELIAKIEQINRQPEIGELVAGYRVDAVIREGRYGTVFRATEMASGVEFAIRVMTGNIAQDAFMRARVLGLQRALAQVENPAVLKVHAAGGEGHRLFIATPLLDGMTLRRVLARRGRLPISQSVRIALEIADGLAAAHTKGLAHGGIGTSNVMLLGEGEHATACIIDFQLAAGVESATPAADVMALGQLLRQLITGNEGRAGELPEPWRAIVDSATEGQYPTAVELAVALRHAITEPGSEAVTELHDRYSSAFDYARSVHRGDVRKGTSIPYLAHLLAVSALVLEDDGSEDEAIAALLHDAAEDHGGEQRLTDIERRFGPTVARIVCACSDTLLDPKPPWQERKERYLEHLRTAQPDELRVSLADKLHNARAILTDLKNHGQSVWSRFNVTDPEQQLWYYAALADLFRQRHPGFHARALQDVVAELEQLIRRTPNVR